jgi:large subunit ribosomal protein L35
MPKIKTRQAVAKRFKVTKKKKVMKRSTGQDHFNARESGKQKRSKRLDKSVSEADARNIRRMIGA